MTPCSLSWATKYRQRNITVLALPVLVRTLKKNGPHCLRKKVSGSGETLMTQTFSHPAHFLLIEQKDFQLLVPPFNRRKTYLLFLIPPKGGPERSQHLYPHFLFTAKVMNIFQLWLLSQRTVTALISKHIFSARLYPHIYLTE